MRVGIAIGLITLLVAGCAGDSGGIPRGALAGVVLQAKDLPAPFVQFDEGPQGVAETTSGFRADPLRFGRVEGWKARYRRPGTATTPGPLVIESRADLFEDDDGAAKDFTAYRKELEQSLRATGGRRLESLELGEDAVGLSFREDRVRFFRIAWRHANVTALLFVNGFEGLLELEDVLALARKQQRRLEEAG